MGSFTPGPLDRTVGERLELSDYTADFSERFQSAKEFWKLERGQAFAEPSDESWQAFARGDWDECLRLIEARRADRADYQRRNQARGMTSRRVRVVELPPTPYLHWELRVLLLRDGLGHPTRVVPPAAVAGLEARGPLPEIGILDSEVMYEVIYAPDGAASHVILYSDAAFVGQYRNLIADLYADGEPLRDFFCREIESLPLPVL